MISTEKLKRLRELAEHKLAVAKTSVTGSVRFAAIEPLDLLALIEIAEEQKRSQQARKLRGELPKGSGRDS